MARIGAINRLVVERKTDIGYMLGSDQGEIFLHANETSFRELEQGETVDAFLYFDQKGRLAATLKEPLITVDEPAFLTVKDTQSFGCFMDMGISKDVLLSKDVLPKDRALWPIEGDRILCTLKVKKRFVVRIAAREEVPLTTKKPLERKDVVEARVHRIGNQGIDLVTDDYQFIFVHHTMYKRKYRIGETVEVKVVYHSDQGYTGSLIPQKEVAIHEDANRILSYLNRRGEIPLTSESPPEEIEAILGMSKKAFKRAVGKLYRERKIIIDEGSIRLVVEKIMEQDV
ncbi:MAG: S1 RNA-binding domain-containing protein [Acholeplasmataceae bacterium]